MVNKLMIDNGFYILVNFEVKDNLKIFKMELGKAYEEDGVKTISMTEDGKFVRYFENDNQKAIRDLSTTNTFEEIVLDYITLLPQKFPKNAIIQNINGNYVNYFNEEQ